MTTTVKQQLPTVREQQAGSDEGEEGQKREQRAHAVPEVPQVFLSGSHARQFAWGRLSGDASELLVVRSVRLRRQAEVDRDCIGVEDTGDEARVEGSAYLLASPILSEPLLRAARRLRPERPYRGRDMQNRAYELPRFHLLRTSVDKPSADASCSVGWHHGGEGAS